MRAVLSDFEVEKNFDVIRTGDKVATPIRNMTVRVKLFVSLAYKDDPKEIEIQLLRWAEILCGGPPEEEL